MCMPFIINVIHVMLNIIIKIQLYSINAKISLMLTLYDHFHILPHYHLERVE